MRSRASRSAKTLDADVERPLLRALGWSPRDAVAFVVGGLATVAILTNLLFMQKGSHPAPMFKATVAKPAALAQSVPAPAARPRPAEAASVPTPVPAPAKVAAAPSPRTPGEIIGDIQRELASRGYHDGTVDGFYGPKTDAAIRDFEQAAGLKPSAEPSEALLQSIARAPAKLAKGITGATAVARPPVPVRIDAERPPPSKRVIALQRALADYGYGQIRPTGIMDADTQAAIEKFERERKLPVTGQPSDRVLREMTAMTGRVLE